MDVPDDTLAIYQERDMLGSILDLHEIEVKNVMIHRKHVETIDADLPADTLEAQAVSTMHSRIPLWRGEPDNILGVLHVKNLIKLIGEGLSSASSLMVPVRPRAVSAFLRIVTRSLAL